MKDHYKDQLLECLMHYVTLDIRQKLMDEVPAAYNAYHGREILKVVVKEESSTKYVLKYEKNFLIQNDHEYSFWRSPEKDEIVVFSSIAEAESFLRTQLHNLNFYNEIKIEGFPNVEH